MKAVVRDLKLYLKPHSLSPHPEDKYVNNLDPIQKEPSIRQTNIIPQDAYFCDILYTENHHSKLAKPETLLVIFSIDSKIAPIYSRLKPTNIKELNIKSTNYINRNQSSNKCSSSLPVRTL